MLERFLFKKIEVWIVLLLLISGMVGVVFFGAAVRSFYQNEKHGKLATWANTIASIPHTTQQIIKGDFGKADLEAHEQRFNGLSGFVFNFHRGERPDLGYLLLNRYDFDLGMSVSELVDLNTQETLHQWRFDVTPLWNQSKLKSNLIDFKNEKRTERFRTGHNYLLENGTIVSASSTPLFSVDICSRPALLNDKSIFHHSIEIDHKGNFWIPKHFEPKQVRIGTNKFYDDGIAQISPDGNVLFEKSVVGLLNDNGLGYLIYGKGRNRNDDPIHLNDIQPALEDGQYWKRGDVFLSLRNQSMVLLYRPDTNKILWHHEGTWIHQHDVNIIDDHRISIFDNNAPLDVVSKSGVFSKVDGSNNEYIFNFRSGEFSSPFLDAFKSLDVRSETQGRGTIINANEIFVEETTYGRLLQFNKSGDITWQYINRASNGKVYYVSWSRLIPRALGDRVRNAIKEKNC